MRKLATLTAVSALALGLSVGTAYAEPPGGFKKGIFEGPMVDTAAGTCTDTEPDGECDGSEGKVEGNGDWKVEINGVPVIADQYEVCIDDVLADPVSLADELDPEGDPGELKATDADGNIVPSNTYQRPSLQVRADTGDPCTGTLHFETGFAL